MFGKGIKFIVNYAGSCCAVLSLAQGKRRGNKTKFFQSFGYELKCDGFPFRKDVYNGFAEEWTDNGLSALWTTNDDGRGTRATGRLPAYGTRSASAPFFTPKDRGKTLRSAPDGRWVCGRGLIRFDTIARVYIRQPPFITGLNVLPSKFIVLTFIYSIIYMSAHPTRNNAISQW